MPLTTENKKNIFFLIALLLLVIIVQSLLFYVKGLSAHYFLGEVTRYTKGIAKASSRTVEITYKSMNKSYGYTVEEHVLWKAEDSIKQDKSIIGNFYLIAVPEGKNDIAYLASRNIPIKLAKKLSQPDTGWIKVPKSLKPYLLENK